MEERQTACLFTNGSSVINYTYNADGVRIGKSGSRAGTFIVSGTQILREINSVATIDYLYDENGSPIGLTYKGTTYYYRKNLQGDIINITDSTGAKVVTYIYNAWGKLMSMTGNMELAVNNPFRYRGYYYDVESGLYYLNSRYYDPQTGRFINADDTDTLLYSLSELTDKNLFAYCDNNPIMRMDDSGDFWMFIGAAIGAAVGGAVSAISQYAATGKIDWKVVGVNAASGAISGALASTGIGLVASIGANAVLGGITYAAEQIVKGEKITIGGVIAGTISGGIGGAIGGKGANAKALSATWKSTKKVIIREGRRQNRKYASKQIARHTITKSLVRKSVGVSVSRMVAGSIGNSYSRWKMGY